MASRGQPADTDAFRDTAGSTNASATGLNLEGSRRHRGPRVSDPARISNRDNDLPERSIFGLWGFGAAKIAGAALPEGALRNGLETGSL